MEPIYQRVKDAIGPKGVMEEALWLEPDPNEDPHTGYEMKERCANGQWDCEILYEYHYFEEKEKARLERLKEFTQFAAGEVSYEEAFQQLKACLTPRKEGEVLICLEELAKWLEEERERMDPFRLFAFAGRLLMESSSAECIKYALTVLAQKENMEPEQKNQVRTLALCGEFTHYCVPILLQWENGMEELFRVAQRVKGAGRTMAVRRLRPTTQEMRDWMLEEGWKNGHRYTAARCAEQGGLGERLKAPLTPEQLKLCTKLIRTLLDDTVYMEQQWQDIDRLPDGKQILLDWMVQLEDQELDFETVEIISVIIDYVNKERQSWKNEVETAARALLLAPKGRASVEKVIQEGKNYAIGRKLGLPWQEALLANAEKEAGHWELSQFEQSLGNVCSGKNYYYELNLLFQEGEPWAGRVIQVWEKGMFSERADDWTFEHWSNMKRKNAVKIINIRSRYLRRIVERVADYPGQGLSLVLMLLEVPTRASRKRAMKTLESWRDQGWAWTGEVEQAIARRQAADATAPGETEDEEDGDV